MATFRLNKDRDKSLVRDLDQARKIFSEKLLNKKINLLPWIENARGRIDISCGHMSLCWFQDLEFGVAAACHVLPCPVHLVLNVVCKHE